MGTAAHVLYWVYKGPFSGLWSTSQQVHAKEMEDYVSQSRIDGGFGVQPRGDGGD